MRDYKLNEELELKGYWWLPGKDRDLEKIAGSLNLVLGERLILSLQGGLDADINRDWVEPIPIILGDSNGLLVTLVSCMPTFTSFGVGDNIQARESKIQASIAYIGAHFENDAHILFERLFVQIRHLGSWLWTTDTFDIKHGEGLTSSTITMKIPEPIRIEIENGPTFGFAYSSEGPNRNIYSGELIAKVIPHFFYKPTVSMSYADIQLYIRHFQNFFTLAVGSPCAIQSIVGIRASDGSEDNDDLYLRRVSIVYASLEAQSKGHDIHPHEMIFTYSKIADRLEELFTNWYALNEDIRVVQNLYFSTRYHSNMFIENMFINLVQSLESYHRLRFESHLMDKKEYSLKSNDLLNEVPDGIFKELVRQAIAFGNRKTLYDRLIELANNYGRILTGTFGSGREEYLRRVTKTRHYLTHFDPKGRRNILEGSELINAYRLLRIMMEVCFLVELGFEPNEAQELMATKAEFFI